MVGAGHGDQVGLVGGGEPARLGGAADQDRPVDLDGLAAGEDQPGHGAGDARRGRLPGDAGLRPARTARGRWRRRGSWPSWSVVGGRGRRRDRRLGGVGSAPARNGCAAVARRPRRPAGPRLGPGSVLGVGLVGTVGVGSGGDSAARTSAGSAGDAARSRGPRARASGPGATAASRPGRPGPGRWRSARSSPSVPLADLDHHAGDAGQRPLDPGGGRGALERRRSRTSEVKRGPGGAADDDLGVGLGLADEHEAGQLAQPAGDQGVEHLVEAGAVVDQLPERGDPGLLRAAAGGRWRGRRRCRTTHRR